MSRIKNFLVASVSHQPLQQNRSTSRSPTRDHVVRLYRCKCAAGSEKTYACSSAMKWLEESSVRNMTEPFEWRKCMNLYQGLAKNKDASGSETQIMRDVPRTFPNSDTYMNTTDG